MTELKTREGMGKRRAFTELWGISRMCIVEENSPGVRGAGEACSTAWIVAVRMLRVPGSTFETSEPRGVEAGKNAAGGIN